MSDCFVDLTITSPPYDCLRKYDYVEWDFDIFAKIAWELFRVTKKGGVVVWVVNDKVINGSETGTSFRQALHFKDVGFNLHDTMIYSADKPPQTKNRYDQKFEYMFVLSKGRPKTFNPLREPCVSAGSTRSHGKGKKRHDEIINGSDKPNVKTYVKPDKYRGNIWHYRIGANDRTDHPAVFPEKLVQDHVLSWSNESELVYDCFAGSGTTAKMCVLLKRNWIMSEINEEYCEIIKKRLSNHSPLPLMPAPAPSAPL